MTNPAIQFEHEFKNIKTKFIFGLDEDLDLFNNDTVEYNDEK
mgnify:CR=1 FL=1